MSYHTEYYKKRRDQFINLLGGSCANCGATNQLEFDHIDPSTKQFSIGKLLNVSYEKALAEVRKCQLLCKSCHKIKTNANKDGYDRRAKGTSVATAILTDDIVKQIKDRRAGGATLTQLVKEFGYKKATINAIIAGITWKHI